MIKTTFREVLSSVTVISHQLAPYLWQENCSGSFFPLQLYWWFISQILEISFLSSRIKSICHNVPPRMPGWGHWSVHINNSGFVPLLQHQFNIKYQCYFLVVLVTVFLAAVAIENTFMKKCSKSIAVPWGWKSCLLSVFNSYCRLLAFSLLCEPL